MDGLVASPDKFSLAESARAAIVRSGKLIPPHSIDKAPYSIFSTAAASYRYDPGDCPVHFLNER